MQTEDINFAPLKSFKTLSSYDRDLFLSSWKPTKPPQAILCSSIKITQGPPSPLTVVLVAGMICIIWKVQHRTSGPQQAQILMSNGRKFPSKPCILQQRLQMQLVSVCVPGNLPSQRLELRLGLNTRCTNITIKLFLLEISAYKPTYIHHLWNCGQLSIQR